jgi:hypothetical protein
MAKPKSSSPKPPRSPEQSGAARRTAIVSVLLILGLTASTLGYLRVRKYVETKAVYSPDPPIVVLKNPPVWMSGFLADTIATSVRPDTSKSPFDNQLLKDAYESLRVNPWIKTVRQVRRVYGKAPGDTLEVDCDYRAPVALVAYEDKYTLVDADRVILPEQFRLDDLKKVMYGNDAAQGKLQLRIIEGVTHRPTEAGAVWEGKDLAAGLRVAQLLAHQPFAEEIVRIDVSNADGRRDRNEAHVVLYTKANTQLRWGRDPNPDEFIEAKPNTKLVHMAQIYKQYHRIDAGQPWLDLRFDRVMYPVQTAITETATTASTR